MFKGVIMQKSLFNQIPDKLDEMVWAFRKVLDLEEKIREEEKYSNKLLLLTEAKKNVRILKQVNLWADTNLKDKQNAFHRNYVSVNYQYRVYMQIIFKQAVKNNNNLFAKAMFQGINKCMDFNGKDFLSVTPINYSIICKNKDFFDYLINKSKKHFGLTLNFENDNDEEKSALFNCRTQLYNNFKFQTSPLFTALSLFDKNNNNCNFADFVLPLIENGGVDLPKILYLNVPNMKNVIDFVNEYRNCVKDGFENSKYSDIKKIYPAISKQPNLNFSLAYGIKIEPFCPNNYEPEFDFNNYNSCQLIDCE